MSKEIKTKSIPIFAVSGGISKTTRDYVMELQKDYDKEFHKQPQLSDDVEEALRALDFIYDCFKNYSKEDRMNDREYKTILQTLKSQASEINDLKLDNGAVNIVYKDNKLYKAQLNAIREVMENTKYSKATFNIDGNQDGVINYNLELIPQFNKIKQIIGE